MLLQIGPLAIYPCGVAAAIGLLLAAAVVLHESRRLGLSEYVLLDLSFYGLIAGLLGARIWYVVAQWPYYADNRLKILTAWRGGLAVEGAVLGVMVAVWWVGHRGGLSLWRTGDGVAPAVVLFYAVRTAGGLLSGCSPGVACSLPWSASWVSSAALPAVAYEVASDLVILAILWTLRWRAGFDGLILSLYIIAWSVVHLLVELAQAWPEPAMVSASGPAGIGTGLALLGWQLWHGRGQAWSPRSRGRYEGEQGGL